MSKGTINKAILIGRLGNDPELRYTPAGDAVANFSIATNRGWKDKEGNQQERTDWHKIVAWRKLAEICGEYLKKGSLVYVEGRIETSSYTDKNEVKRYTTNIVANQVQMLGSRSDTAKDKSSDESKSKEEPEKESKNPFDKEETKSEKTKKDEKSGWGEDEIPF